MPNPTGGFTLIELLVVIGIISILTAIGWMGFTQMLAHSRMMAQIGAAKNLISAFRLYAAEHDGQMLPAMDLSAGSTGNPVWFEPYKRNISFSEAPFRYPFRLAPYLDYNLKASILLPDNERQINRNFGQISGSNTMSDYAVSLFPSMGMNYDFIGGNRDGSGTPENSPECVSRQGQTDHSLIVFVSAGFKQSTNRFSGYFKVGAPTGGSSSSAWSTAAWSTNASPNSYGYVDARYNGKAVCAMLDGSTQLKTITELRDMRLWSRQAAESDNPSYKATW